MASCGRPLGSWSASWPSEVGFSYCVARQEAESVSTGSDDTKAPPTKRLAARYGGGDRKSSTTHLALREWTADWPTRRLAPLDSTGDARRGVRSSSRNRRLVRRAPPRRPASAGAEAPPNSRNGPAAFLYSSIAAGHGVPVAQRIERKSVVEGKRGDLGGGRF